MNSSERVTPPLSPVLLAGFAIRPLPLVLLQPVLDAAMALVRKRHPDVFERLSGLEAPVYRIDPVDLPFDFILCPDPEKPKLTAVPGGGRDGGDDQVTAIIRGPLLSLIELLEGRLDGDAMFFSRDLVIEGDTEAVIALRNAVDGAEIDIAGDLLSMLGPLAGPVRFAAKAAGVVFSMAASDLEKLRASVIAPAMRRRDSQADELRELEKKIEAGAKHNRRSKSGNTRT
ncbi:MAG: SCP2 sterol-binding domain-containing protein [Rhodospirillales bacterium]